MASQTKATTTTADRALTQELAALEARRAVLLTALAALRGTNQTSDRVRLMPPTKAPRTGWMRKAKRGERQATVLQAYESLTHEVPVRDFVRGLGTTDRQRKLFRLAVDRQVGLGRMASRDGVLLPRVA